MRQNLSQSVAKQLLRAIEMTGSMFSVRSGGRGIAELAFSASTAGP
jgi:hypothetical protein